MAGTEEIGVIPYYKRNNSFRFVIVTSRKHPKKWIFPKGQPEDDETSRETAVNEAFEEAGIIGTIRGKSIKVKAEKRGETVTYRLYPFRISRICKRWPERRIRNRMFVKKGRALKLLDKHPYAEALNIFLKNY